MASDVSCSTDSHPKVQVEREANGWLRPGHNVGAETRFKPGESGNPTGRKSYGAYASEWMNSMAAWTEAQIREVISNRAAEPAAKVAAARRVLSAMGENKQGDEKFDRCCDRTSGRPRQSVELDARTQVDPALELTGRVLSELHEAVNGNGTQSA